MNGDTVDILLVEDDPMDVRLTLRALSASGMGDHVEVARDGEEALDFLFRRETFADAPQERKPRMIMLDLKVPKVSGAQVLREIKADPKTRAIPVVVLTSSRLDSDVAECYRLGANSYIQKPLDYDEFRTKIVAVAHYWLTINQSPPERAQSAAV
jgi:CheY-like chemotaxis protein